MTMGQQLDYDELRKHLSIETLDKFGDILQILNTSIVRSPWYKLQEAAEYLRCGVTTIRRLIDEGLLKSHRLDQRAEKSTILIHRKDMDALILFGKSRGLQPREQKLLKFMQS
jgi:excisionase family DNA binding protein